MEHSGHDIISSSRLLNFFKKRKIYEQEQKYLIFP